MDKIPILPIGANFGYRIASNWISDFRYGYRFVHSLQSLEISEETE